MPDISYSGKFYWEAISDNKSNTTEISYNGKVIILVNEYTQSKGIKINIEVKPDSESIVKGNDKILDKALEIL